MKIQGVLVWPVKKESFWAKFGCRTNFSSTNHTMVFGKSAMYDISFSSKTLPFNFMGQMSLSDSFDKILACN